MISNASVGSRRLTPNFYAGRLSCWKISERWIARMARSPNSDIACSRFRSIRGTLRMLLIADELGCVPTVALIAALTQERHLLRRSENNQMEHDRELLLGKEVESDFFVLIRAWLYAQQHGADKARRLGIRYAVAQQVAQVFEQFIDIARTEGLERRQTSRRVRCRSPR